MRNILAVCVMAVAVAGCAGVERALAPPEALVDGWIYALAGAARLSGQAPAPAPVPTPAPGTCLNCKGTGKLPGDGKIFPTCPECNGTGKTPTPAKSPKPPAPKPVSKTPAKSVVVAPSTACGGGACTSTRGILFRRGR